MNYFRYRLELIVSINEVLNLYIKDKKRNSSFYLGILDFYLKLLKDSKNG